MYRILSRLWPHRSSPELKPERILFIRTCCLGDVVLATAALEAIRRQFPDANITWAVGSWSRKLIEQHPSIDAILETGQAALPVKKPRDFFTFVQQIRNGQYDLVVSLVRSPLMSLAVSLSGVPYRVGIDSGGRGFGYNIRVPIDPTDVRHEALIYLDVVERLGIETQGLYPNLPVTEATQLSVKQLLAAHNITGAYIVVNPAGGSNPGMKFAAKRYPVDRLAALVDQLYNRYQAQIVLIGGPADGDIVTALESSLRSQATPFVGTLSFAQIGAIARNALVYIGNDTGLTHLAAASGARTAMLMGPSDPKRYGPYSPDAIALWKPWAVNSRGVAAESTTAFDWTKHGIEVDTAFEEIVAFIDQK